MKFSIIVPVYNAERYLPKLIGSVLQQTYSDYELILVDDGSTDNSLSLMLTYQEENDRIKVYTKKNTGPGLTRKFGYDRSDGDLIFFVDSDDWITTPQSLEEIAKIFQANPEIDVLFFDREDIIGEKKSVIRGFNTLSEGIHSIEELDEEIRPGLGAKILKKSILLPEMFIESSAFEDLFTTYEYLERCNNFYYVPKCFYTIYHETSSTSLSSRITAKYFYESIQMALLVYNRTKKPSLRYSLELKLGMLLTLFWKLRLKRTAGINSKNIRIIIADIVSILRKNGVIIKPNGMVRIKRIIYRVLLIISST